MVSPLFGEIPILTHIFQLGWNHHLEYQNRPNIHIKFFDVLHFIRHKMISQNQTFQLVFRSFSEIGG